jgi:hypothetical protein
VQMQQHAPSTPTQYDRTTKTRDMTVAGVACIPSAHNQHKTKLRYASPWQHPMGHFSTCHNTQPATGGLAELQ